MTSPSLFISYSSADRAAAEAIHASLEADGFNVWRDQTRLEQNWSREIAHALAGTDVVLVLWSGPASQSTWVGHEWLTARALEKYILPCLLPGAPALPAPLTNLHGIVAAPGVDIGAAIAQRIAAVGVHRMAYDYTIPTGTSYVPFNPNPRFTGRAAALVDLYLALVGDLQKLGLSHVAVVGMAGIGKTQLVVELLHRFAFGFPDGIFWIQAAEADRWMLQIVELARDRLGLAVGDPADASASRQAVYAFQTWCKAHPRALLVMDNVREPALLNNDTRLFGLTPLTLGCSVLFTTRTRSAPPGVQVCQVDALDPDAALELLTASRAAASEEDRRSATAICNAVAYLPLALTLAGGYLAKYLDVSFAEYLAELQQNALGVIDIGAMTAEELGTRHEASVTATLAGQWTMLQDEIARLLFTLLGQLPEAAIVPDARMALLAGIQATSKLDRPVARALNLLADLNLAERMEATRSAVRLHPLVRDFAATLVPPGQTADLRGSAATRVAAAYADPSRLASETSARGATQIMADLGIALAWWPTERVANDDLRLLQRLLDRERHNLQVGQPLLTGIQAPRPKLVVAPGFQQRPTLQPAAVLQQLHYRAFHMGLQALAARLFETATKPQIKLIALSEREDPALVRSFIGHGSSVADVALSADDRLVVSGSDDKSAIVWDVETGQPLRLLASGEDKVWRVGLSADSRRVIAGGDGHTIRQWDLESGGSTAIYEGGGSVDDVGVRAVCMPAIGPYRAVAWLGITFVAWADGSRVTYRHDRTTLPGVVTSVCLNQDGTRALVHLGPDLFEQNGAGQWVPNTSPVHRLLVVDTGTGEVLQEHPGALHPIGAIALSTDGTLAVAACRTRLLLWHLDSGTSSWLATVHEQWISALAIAADRRFIISGGNDRALVLWNAETGAPVRQYRGHAGAVTGVAIASDGRFAMTASEDRTLRLWDLRIEVPAVDRTGHLARPVCLTGDGSKAVTGSRDGTIVLWDTADARALRTCAHSVPIVAVAISADERYALAGCEDGDVLLWDLEMETVVHVLRGHASLVSAVAFSGDGSRAVSAAREGPIVWDLETGEPRAGVAADGYWYRPVCFSQDGTQVLTCATADITIWNIVGSDLVRQRTMTGLWYSAADFNPARQLAVASALGSLDVWNLSTGALTKKFVAHTETVQAVCLSSDGRYAVTACQDEGTLAVWDLASATSVARLVVKTAVAQMAMAGNRLAIIDAGGAVEFMDVVFD